MSFLTESERQSQAPRDLINVVNVLPQYGCVVAAARVVLGFDFTLGPLAIRVCPIIGFVLRQAVFCDKSTLHNYL